MSRKVVSIEVNPVVVADRLGVVAQTLTDHNLHTEAMIVGQAKDVIRELLKAQKANDS